MLGGTTTALLSFLESIDYDRYDVDLIMYRNAGEAIDRIPQQVTVLREAAREKKAVEITKKVLLSICNGQLFRAFYYIFKYRDNDAKSKKMIIWQATEKSHGLISRKLDEEYDVAIGFIESWAAHYIVTSRVQAKKKFIWIHPDVEKSYLIPELDSEMYKTADKIVTISDECCLHLQKHLPLQKEKICVIENLLDVYQIRKRAHEAVAFSVPTDKVKLVSVCRIDYSSKGLDRALKALKKLKEADDLDSLVWYWIGDGPDLENARQYITQNNLTDIVILLGRKENPLPYEAKMDLFFLPSRYEGKPMAVTEAQMIGLPCAVTAYTSANEQIADGIDGKVIPNNDDDVYDFLKNLIHNKYDIEQWKRNIAEKSFSDEVAIKKIEALLEL